VITRALPAMLAVLVLAGGAVGADSALTPNQESRYQALIDELRCVVCQNQTIAESDAPLAADLREIVREQIAAGKSDAEIEAYLVERYGDFVLYDPPFKPVTWLLWLGPGLLLLGALIALVWLLRRSGREPEPPAPDREAVERVLRGRDER